MKEAKKYGHFDQLSRDRLQALLACGCKQIVIAKILGVSQASISRELKRNCRKRSGSYEATSAEHKALVRREASKYQGMKIEKNNALRIYIIDKLKAHWNPDEIAGRMKDDQAPFYASKTAIYDWLRSSWGQQYCVYLYSRSYHKRKRKKKTEKVMIPNRIGIGLRPLGATNRTRYGHWEGDTVVSGKLTGSRTALSVIYERKAKYIEARRIKNLRPESHNQALLNMLENKKTLSLTQDNGIENRAHEKLGIKTFFCNPYSSWQKGGVEQAIKMIRWFIPKGKDIKHYPKEYVKLVITLLNKKPRKSLGYKTPNEIMQEKNLLKDINTEEYALEG